MLHVSIDFTFRNLFSLLDMHTRREINYFTNDKNEAQKNAGYCLVLFCFALLLLFPFSAHLLNATPALLCLPTLGLVLGTSQLAVSFLFLWSAQVVKVLWEDRSKAKRWRERKHQILCLWLWCPLFLLGTAVTPPSQSEHLRMQQHLRLQSNKIE